MKLYTRTGDDGSTSLFGGRRVSKADVRVDAYGTLDEASCAIGLARAHGVPPEVDAVLEHVQRDLFTVGAEVASGDNAEAKLSMALIGQTDIDRLELAIDEADKGLAPLRAFILPGGTASASALHLGRTVTRRAERALVALSGTARVRAEVLVYVNRLSDLLFVLARSVNRSAGRDDVQWMPDKR